jgi:hypothetical protein
LQALASFRECLRMRCAGGSSFRLGAIFYAKTL